MNNFLANVADAQDPSLRGYPATLPVEIALRTASIKELCYSYSISHDEWMVIKDLPSFRAEVARAVERLKVDGMAFKMRAELQSMELLKESWRLIHDKTDTVPPSVKADLIKFTIRCAGLDASKDAAQAGGGGVSFAINLNLR